MSNILSNFPPPKKSGVYIYKNIAGEIIYIGKAKNLFSRVGSYFANTKKDIKTQKLVEGVFSVEYIITDNEEESLILENILIKKHKPKFNIKLRDDKNYQYIVIDYRFEIAKIYATRSRNNLGKKHIKYFGPYTSGFQVKKLTKLIKNTFPYCTAKKIGMPCFNYHMHRCPGVCIGEIDVKKYNDSFLNIELFLKGQIQKIKNKLIAEMNLASKEKNFEKALKLRDQINVLNIENEKQKIIFNRNVNKDYISIWQIGLTCAINLFIVREGKLIWKENMLIKTENMESESEILTAFVEKHYIETENIPDSIICQEKIESENLIMEFLKNKENCKKNITFKVPKSGKDFELINMGIANAEDFLFRNMVKNDSEKIIAKSGLLELKNILKLKKLPQRIECYDISNISGKYATGSMVVLTNGKIDKKEYRKFKIKTADSPNDYLMMKEILKRRMKNNWTKADLWILDGGKGQLNIGLEVLKELDEKDIFVIGIAKNKEGRNIGKETIFWGDENRSIILPNENPALQMIQRIRDEAHRFAINYHRKIRSEGLLRGYN